MGKWKRARLILVLWAAAVLCLAVYAVVAKRMRQDWIAGAAVAALETDAESGTMEGSDYLWSANGYGWQGPMIDLIEHHRHYPEMERVMLLLEGRRVYDWVYLYPRYRNADLRDCLMRHCLEHYPDDPLVHWAAGRLKLAGGEYAGAAEELRQAQELGFSPQAAGVPEEHFAGRLETAMFLAGNFDSIAEAYAEAHSANPLDIASAEKYLDLLCRMGRYDEVLAEAQAVWPAGRYPPGIRPIVMRALFWSGNVAGYRVEAEKYVGRFSDRRADYAEAMLALLDHDSRDAMMIAGNYPTHDYWWSGWIDTWMYYRLLADAYAVTGDGRYISALDDWNRRVSNALDTQHRWERDRVAIGAQKARAFMMRGEWDKAEQALADISTEGVYDDSATLLVVSSLVAIRGDEPLEEHSLAVLAATGAAVNLVISPELASAAEAGGMTLQQARDELLQAIKPERRNFYGYYYWNEEAPVLDW